MTEHENADATVDTANNDAAIDTANNEANEARVDAVEDDGAVDTGRRIDPGSLQFRGTRLRRDPAHPSADGDSASDDANTGNDRPRRDAPNQDGGGADARGRGGGQKRGRRPSGNDGGGLRVVEKDSLYGKRDAPARGGKSGGPRRDDDAMPPRRERGADAENDTTSFADMFAAAEKKPRVQALSVGDRVVDVECVLLGHDTAFFAIDGKAEAFMSLGELVDDHGAPTIAVGDKISGYVVSLRNGIELSKKIGRDRNDPALLEEAKNSKVPVDGKVTGVNKGGLEVELMGTRAFCPMGQADLGFLPDASSLVGQTLSFLITEVKERGKNIVVSRRALLEREKKEIAKKTLSQIQIGMHVEGTVVRVQPFGAFVDIGGVDGLIPVSELSWARVEDPQTFISVNDRVKVEILRIEPDEKRKGELRITLSKKRASPDPFTTHVASLVPGSNVAGRVTRLERFGAFVELFERGSGVEGLVHISALSDRRVVNASEVVKAGDEVTVRILDVNREEKRISLSLKDADLPEGKSRDQVVKDAVRGISRGKRVTGVVDRIERYGVFLKLEDGPSALMPLSESGTERGDDISRAFPMGSTHEVLVIDIDDRNRVKVSKIAREREEERGLMAEFQERSGGAQGLGTFGDLLRAKLAK